MPPFCGAEMRGQDYSIREMEPSDLPAVVELMSLGLGEGQLPRHPAAWNWKHESNPFGRSLVLVAEASGLVIGHRAFMRWVLQQNGSTMGAFRAVDTVTHPSWQGSGVFRHLTSKLLDRLPENGAGLVFNTPNNRSLPGYLKMGWRVAGRPPIWIKPLRPFRTAWGQWGRSRTSAGSGNAPRPSGDLNELLSSPWLSRFLEQLRGNDRHRLMTPRTTEYLRWRYAEVPGIRYHGRGVFRDNAGAILIWRVRQRHRLSELRVCELMLTPGATGVALVTDLLSRTLRESTGDLASMVATPDSPERTIGIRLGFLPSPKRPVLAVRRLNSEGSQFQHIRQWRLSAGDLELF